MSPPILRRSEHICGRPIKLLVPHAIRVGRDLEAASLVSSSPPQKRWANRSGVAVPIDRTVHAYQGNSPHVADDSVIFDRLIRHCKVPFRLRKEPLGGIKKAIQPTPCAQIEQPWILRPLPRRHVSRSQPGCRQPRKLREGSFQADNGAGEEESRLEPLHRS